MSKLADALKLIPLIGAAIKAVEKFVNGPPPRAPRDPHAAKKAKEKWENDKRSF